MTSTTRARAGAGRRFAAIGVGVLFALVFAEAALRVCGLGGAAGTKYMLVKEGDMTVEYHCYPSNPSGEFQRLPDLSAGRWHAYKFASPPVVVPLSAVEEDPWCVEYRRESVGVRGPAVADSPAPGVARFAGIGDSFALGEGVPYEKTLFAHLGRMLGPEYEFLNCAVSGVDTELELREIELSVPRYHCSRALVIFNLNDVKFSPQIRERLGGVYDLVNVRAAQTDAHSGPWYRRAFHVVEFVASAIEARRITRETAASYLDAYDPEKNADNLAVLATQFRKMAQTPGCNVGLAIYPMMYGLSGTYPLQPCHDRVLRMAKEAGLPAIDLAPEFAGQDDRSLHVHPLDHHPNGRAHEIAAHAIAGWIRAEPTLRR